MLCIRTHAEFLRQRGKTAPELISYLSWVLASEIFNPEARLAKQPGDPQAIRSAIRFVRDLTTITMHVSRALAIASNCHQPFSMYRKRSASSGRTSMLNNKRTKMKNQEVGGEEEEMMTTRMMIDEEGIIMAVAALFLSLVAHCA